MEASQHSNLEETVADHSDEENMDIPETEKSQTESSGQDDPFPFNETPSQNESFQESTLIAT